MAAYSGGTTAGDGGTASVATITMTVPSSGVKAGDVAVIGTDAHSNTVTLTTPTGWTLRSGPDATTTLATGWLLTKTLIAGDLGATVTLTISATRRFTATMDVFTSATETGLQFAVTTDSATNTTPTLPTLTGVTAGSAVYGNFGRRTATTTADDVGTPTGYTAGQRAGTAASAAPNVSTESCYQIAATTGSYGGDTTTATVTALGVYYLVSIPGVAGASASHVFNTAARFRAANW